MSKLAQFPILLMLACVVAGTYGSIHNQISYTVSPDYFHAFKFHQFHVPEVLQSRLGASLVGWLASWWMGLIVGAPVLLVGLILPDADSYRRHALTAFVVVVVTTLVVGLGALAYGYLTISESTLQEDWRPYDVSDRIAFARAGNMHNFSYAGGAIGVITGSAYLFAVRMQIRRRANNKT